MQIPSIPTPSAGAATVPVARQQTVELAQGGAGGGTTAVRPESAQAVAAVGKPQEQQTGDQAKGKQSSVTEQLQDSLKQLNSVASVYNSQLEFSVDKDTNLQVVKVVDKESQKVIRQIPSEDAIRIAKAIGDFKGLLLKEQA